MWFFLLVNSVIPLLTLLIGSLFYFKPPEKINYIYGYRTTMSMKTQETWDFAHRYCGKVWIGVGILMLAITGVLLLIFLDGVTTKPDDRMAFIVLIQVILMVGSIIPVEIILRKTFDRDGIRKVK